jgi:hopene-associated glycosyltransferase HpnB
MRSVSLAIAVALAWLYLLLARGWFWRMREQGDSPDPSTWPGVAAVIPARNEAAGVGRAVASLAAQRYGGTFRIVLVDDHSTDHTAEIARASAPREILSVVPANPLPAGWTGKLWAVAEGIRRIEAEPQYLLLTDADIVHPPQNLRRLVARAETGGYDLVSFMATLHCGAAAERALIPAFVFFFFMLYPPAWIRNPRRETAGAAGGCILLRRAMLERIGGIAAIRGELIDDCALAREVKRHGGRVWLGLSRDTRSIRHYRTFGEIAAMISRTAFTQLRHSPVLLAGTVAGMALMYLAPPLLAFAGHGATRATGALAWFLSALAYWPILRFYRLKAWRAPLLPAVAAFYVAATLRSAVDYWLGRGGEWKGRVQDVVKSKV